MKVIIEAKLLEKVPDNHFKGLNLKKEIFKFQKRIDYQRQESPIDIKFVTKNKYLNTEIEKKNMLNPLSYNNINKKVQQYASSDNKTIRKSTNDQNLDTFFDKYTKPKKIPNFNEYKAFMYYQKKKSVEEKIMYSNTFSNIIEGNQNNNSLKEIENNQKLKEKAVYFKDAPSSTSIYAKMTRRRDELIKEIRDKINTNHDILYYFNKEPIEKDKFLNLNQKLPSLHEKKKEDKMPEFLPITYIPETLFDNYSEANRYEKTLQKLLYLQFNIRKSPELSSQTIRNFLLKNGFNTRKLTSSELININCYLSDDNFYINPKLTFKDNVILVLNGTYKPMSMNSSVHDEAKNSFSKSFNNHQNTKQNHNSILDNQEGKAIVKKNNKKVIYTFYETKPNSPKKKRRSSLQEKNIIKNKQITFSNKLYNSNEKKDMTQLITDINNDLNKTNIDFHNNEKYLLDNEYFDSNRLYMKSIKSIPIKESETKLLNNLDRNLFSKKKKLLEYVILKEHNNNYYYKEEAKKLEKEADMRISQFKNNKKTQKLFKINK